MLEINSPGSKNGTLEVKHAGIDMLDRIYRIDEYGKINHSVRYMGVRDIVIRSQNGSILKKINGVYGQSLARALKKTNRGHQAMGNDS